MLHIHMRQRCYTSKESSYLSDSFDPSPSLPLTARPCYAQPGPLRNRPLVRPVALNLTCNLTALLRPLLPPVWTLFPTRRTGG